jgi:hypothetical protein
MATQPKSLEARLRQVRGRKLTAAKRSLALVQDAIIAHDKTLKAGTVPDDGFLASAQKYEQARSELVLLDALAGGGDDGGAVSYGEGITDELRGDLALLVETILSDPQVGGISPGTALARLAGVAWPSGNGPAPATVTQGG